MISAKEKRDQMSLEYWHEVMRKQVDTILRHADADRKFVELEIDVPGHFVSDISKGLCDELTGLGYDVTMVESPPDSFAPQLAIRWSK